FGSGCKTSSFANNAAEEKMNKSVSNDRRMQSPIKELDDCSIRRVYIKMAFHNVKRHFIKRVLLNFAASDSASATAKGIWFIPIVIATSMNHQSVSREICGFQTWSQDRKGTFSVGINKKRRQVTEVSICIRSHMFTCFFGIQMTTCRMRCSH